jgi:hypothetical protein
MARPSQLLHQLVEALRPAGSSPSARRRYGLLAALERATAREDLNKCEPALRPVLQARQLLWATCDPASDSTSRVLARVLVDWLVERYSDGVVAHGWFHVPTPDSKAMQDELHVRLRKKEVAEAAREVAALTEMMWPVLPYLALDWLITERTSPLDLELQWAQVPDGRWWPVVMPSTDRSAGSLQRDLGEALWEEACILLTARDPGRLTRKQMERWARGKAATVVDKPSTHKLERLSAGALDILARRKPLIATYLPTGKPARAAAYVRSALHNAVLDVPAPGQPPPGTIRRAISEGKLPRRPTSAQILEYQPAALARRAHRRPDFFTERELATELNVSLRKVRAARKQVEAESGSPTPRDARSGSFLIDAVLRGAIERRLGVKARRPPRVRLATVAKKLDLDHDMLRELCRRMRPPLPVSSLTERQVQELLEALKASGRIDISPTVGEWTPDDGLSAAD